MNELELFAYVKAKLESKGLNVQEKVPDLDQIDNNITILQTSTNGVPTNFDGDYDEDLSVTIVIYMAYMDDCRTMVEELKQLFNSDVNNFTNWVSSTLPLNIDANHFAQATIEFDYN